MEVITDFYMFLIVAIFLSLSGVMSPGPLFAVTIAKAFKDNIAGVLISLGHAIVEFPLMFLAYFGSSWLLESSVAQKTIGFVGGLILVYMGVKMFRKRQETLILEVRFPNLRNPRNRCQSLLPIMVGDRWRRLSNESPHLWILRLLDICRDPLVM